MTDAWGARSPASSCCKASSFLTRPRCRDGEILKDAAAIVDIFFYGRERDRPPAFLQRHVFPPKGSVELAEDAERRAVVRLRLHDLFLLGASRFKRSGCSCLIFGHARQQPFAKAVAQNDRAFVPALIVAQGRRVLARPQPDRVRPERKRTRCPQR